jgi:hypothetical protein
MDLVTGLNSSLNRAASILRTAMPVIFQNNATNISAPSNTTQFDPFFQFCNLTNPRLDPLAFFEPDFFNTTPRKVYRSITAQIANQNLMTSSEVPFTGTFSLTANRLLVRTLSLRIMESTLAVLILIIFILCKFRPTGSTPRDPGTITGLASILARSPKLSELLASCGASSLEDIQTALAHNTYQTVITREHGVSMFSIMPSSLLTTNLSPPLSVPTSVTWWEPFSVTLLARMLALIVPLALIAALEATYQRSQHNNGLATVQTETYVRYTWVYVPALIMLGVTTLFGQVAFSTKVFHPYYMLKRGGVAVQQSMTENYLSRENVHSFASSLRKRHYEISAISLAMLLAPMLTIVVRYDLFLILFPTGVGTLELYFKPSFILLFRLLRRLLAPSPSKSIQHTMLISYAAVYILQLR